MIIKYKNRRIESQTIGITSFAHCIDKKGKQIGQSITASEYGEKDAINKMKKLVDRAIQYNRG